VQYCLLLKRDSCFMNRVLKGHYKECQVIENPYLKEGCESIVTQINTV